MALLYICLAPCFNRSRPRRRPSSSPGDRGSLQDGRRKASDGSFARTTRRTAEDEGRGREGLGQDAKQIRFYEAPFWTALAWGVKMALINLFFSSTNAVN
jgi:hypothetical protein